MVGDPVLLATHSWRTVLPMLADKLELSALDKLAIGDWQDPSLAYQGGEVPAALRHGSAKRALSRDLKLRCFQALRDFDSNNVPTWSTMTTQAWSVLAEACQVVDAFDTSVVWSNLDLSGGEHTSTVRVARPRAEVMPRVTNKKLMCAFSRGGS